MIFHERKQNPSSTNFNMEVIDSNSMDRLSPDDDGEVVVVVASLPQQYPCPCESSNGSVYGTATEHDRIPSPSTTNSVQASGPEERSWIRPHGPTNNNNSDNIKFAKASMSSNSSAPSSPFRESRLETGFWLLGILALFSVTSSCLGVAACQQPIGNPNNEIIGDTFESVIGTGQGGSADGQLSTDNSNLNSVPTGGGGSGSSSYDNGNNNGGEISGSTPFGSGSGLPTSNGNEKQPGLLCPDIYPVESFPPKAPIIPDFFTVAVETIYLKEQKRQVWNLHVDRAEKIVVHKIDMPNNGKRYDWFYTKIVRDFRSGLEFRISNAKDSADCVVEPISTEFELTSLNLKRFMLEHAKLLLNFDPSFVAYWGKRSIRNLQCDIWLHESLGEFVSEFGFANDSIPISVATFSRESKPDIIAISNIYEELSHTFNPFQKTQGHPDVGECLDSTPLLLRIVLDAPYSKLKAGREFTVLESIRRAVAGLAGISLLRVTDLALTEWPSGTSAFWFSLRQIVNFQELSRNNNTSHSTIVFPLADAYRILRDVISRHDVTLRVDLSPNEHMLVGIQRGSLISIPRALHPIFMRNINSKSLSVIKASYTSGAVAGLGLAMAVLGLAIGLLLGFVLWNGSTRMRYWRYPWSNSPIPYGLDA